MIKVSCGCFITEGEHCPKIELVCEEHVGYELYNDYDGRVERLCDDLMEQFTSKEKNP
jgi:hypothetical protein